MLVENCYSAGFNMNFTTKNEWKLALFVKVGWFMLLSFPLVFFSSLSNRCVCFFTHSNFIYCHWRIFTDSVISNELEMFICWGNYLNWC